MKRGRPDRLDLPVLTKGEQRQAEMLAAARRILVDFGYDRFVMREIAAGVGATLGNLQYYYATRDDLLEAVVRAEFDANSRAIAALSSGAGTPDARLEAIARNLIQVWANEGGRVYVVMSLLALHHERFAALHEEIYLAFYEGLLPVLRELRPRTRTAELRRAARLITTIIDGALVQVPGRKFTVDAIAAIIHIARHGT